MKNMSRLHAPRNPHRNQNTPRNQCHPRPPRSQRCRPGIVVLALALLGLALPTVFAVQVVDVQVRSLKGTQMDPNYVLFNTQTRANTELSRTQLAEDIRRLQQTGRFTRVRADFEEVAGGVILIYQVQARSNLRNFVVNGNKKVGDDKIRSLMQLQRGDLVDETRVAVGISSIEEEYRKRFFPAPSIESDLQIDNDTGAADLVLTVDEGSRQRVDEITFTGNKFFTPRELRKVMDQKKDWDWYLKPLELLNRKGQYMAAAVKADRTAIRELYRNEGFLDAEVGEPELFHDGAAIDNLEVRLPISEGPRYKIGQITIDGVTEFPVQQMYQALTAKPRGDARLSAINESRQILRDYYGSRGYVGTGVEMKLTPRTGANVVDVHYQIYEAKLARIRDIHIRGNAVTKDSVIRRELTFFPNEVYNDVRVRNSERRLRNTRLFNYVRANRRPTANPDEYDIIVDVEEGQSGQLLTGFGFSSIDSLVGFVQLSQNNFNLMGPPFTGGGQKLSINASLGTERDAINITHVEPWFLNQKLRLTTKGYRNEWRFLSDEYDQRRTGGSIGISKSLAGVLGDPWRAGLTYGLEEIKVINVSSNASEIIRIEEGSNLKSSLTASVVRDTRDRFNIPTKGNRTTFSAGISGGALGADVDITEYRIRSQQHYPVYKDHVLSFQGHLRTVDSYGGNDRVRIFDRLFSGGPRTIRGFDFRDVGPKDEQGEPLGGESDWWGTAEYTIPLGDALRFATFYDMGMVEENSFDFDFGNFNSSYGVGIRLDIQLPIQLDYSWPIETDEFNDRSSGRFSFMFGGTFN